MHHAFMLLLVAIAVSATRADEPRVSVKLTAERTEFVWGEPVELIVIVKNETSAELKAWKLAEQLDGELAFEPETKRYISTDGKTFKEYETGEFPWTCCITPRPTLTLEPAQELQIRLNILSRRDVRRKPQVRHLVFQPGTYWIKVRYPLIVSDREEFESDEIRVVVNEPTGEDSVVFSRLQTPDVLQFLQCRTGEGAKEALNLLTSYPNSSYAPALTSALREHYDLRKRRLGDRVAYDDEELKSIRDALKIVEPPPWIFPDDDRLDARVTLDYPKPTPLADVLRDVSLQTGVRLRLLPELRARRLTCIRQEISLRDFMENRASFNALWIPQGKEYLLMPLPETQLDAKETDDADDY